MIGLRKNLNKMSLEQQYIDLYRQTSEALKVHSATLLNARRNAAFEKFTQLGFPTTQQENYLYSRVQESLDLNYGLNINRIKISINEKELFSCNVPGIHADLFFMINDQFHVSQQTKSLPNGVIICSLSEACQKYPALVEHYLNRQITDKNDGFVAFNEAFSQDGFFLYVPKNTVCKNPVQLINILRSNVDTMSLGHNLIILEEGAQIKLLVCDHAANDVHFFNHTLTEIFVGENAHFDYYGLESTHLKTTALKQIFVSQKSASQIVMNTIGLNNGCTRNHIEVDMNGSGAETWLGGMLVSDKTQQSENFTVIRHNAPHCKSNELYKYILDGEADGAFSGRIIVKEGAQKTEAYQTNRNICLSKQAQMHAKPQLEIYADDVKCGHGATTGQLDESALFYMQTRGIGKTEARMLLLLAFTADVLQFVEVEALRDRLRTMVERRLRGENAKCQGCGGC